MSRVTPYLMCLALLSVSCASVQPAPVQQDDQIVAAALIHLFTTRTPADQIHVYFIGVVNGDNPLGSAFGLDPSAQLLTRIAPYAPAVRPVSAASSSRVFTDSATGDLGILFVASNMRRRSAHQAELDVTQHFNPNSRMTFTLQLTERQGAWAVETCVVSGESCLRTA